MHKFSPVLTLPDVLAAVRENTVTSEMLRSDSKRQCKYKAQESQLFNPCVSNINSFFHSSISCLPPPDR